MSADFYSLVQRRIWTDARFRGLSKPAPNARDLFLYLLTTPFATQIPGLVAIGEAAMAEDLGWPVDGLKGCLVELEQAGMVKVDRAARLLWLPNGLRHNPPKSPDNVKGWAKCWRMLPECDLLKEAAASMMAAFSLRGPVFVGAFAFASGAPTPWPHGHPKDVAMGGLKAHPEDQPKPVPCPAHQIQEQIQEQQEERNAVSNPPPSGSGLSSDIGPELTTASTCCPETPSAPTTECRTSHAPVSRAQPPVQLALVPTAAPSPSAALVAPRPEPDAEGTTATPDATEPASAKHDPVAAIFSEYIAGWKKQTKGRRAPVLDAKRRRLTLDRLKTFSEEDLKSAARGIWKHPWNLENQQTSYDLAMRDSAHVEKFMAADEASKPQPARGGIPEWLDTGRPSNRLVAYMKSPDYKPNPAHFTALLASIDPKEMQ